MNERHDDLQEIIDAALREMAAEEGDGSRRKCWCKGDALAPV